MRVRSKKAAQRLFSEAKNRIKESENEILVKTQKCSSCTPQSEPKDSLLPHEQKKTLNT